MISVWSVYIGNHKVNNSASLRPGSCLLPQVGNLNRFIDYHLRVNVKILPKSRKLDSGVRIKKWLTNGESPSAIAWLQGYCFSSQYPSSIECVHLRVHPRTSSRSAEHPRIVALTIRALLHGCLRIAARLPSENLCGVSVENGEFSVSRAVHMPVWPHWCSASIQVQILPITMSMIAGSNTIMLSVHLLHVTSSLWISDCYVYMLHTGPSLPDVLLAWSQHQGKELCVQHLLNFAWRDCTYF